MRLPKVDLKKDILIDDESLNNAVIRFNELSNRISQLRNDVSDSLAELKTGFDTPAGHTFFKVCGDKLLKPLKEQEGVIKHVSENLKNANNTYKSVFDEYSTLNQEITNING